MLEVLIMKSLAQDKPRSGIPDPEALPLYDIFDHDITDCGMTPASFASTLQILEKKGYLDVQGINAKEDGRNNLIEENGAISKMLMQGSMGLKVGVRFHVFVNGNIWRLYEIILKEEDIEKINLGTTMYFADDYTVLVNEMRLPIKLKNDAPNEHYILTHMMKNGFEKMYSYTDMIEERVLDDKEWRSYFDACKNLNEKISKQTKGKIERFLEASSGDTGYVRLNPRYL